MVSGLSKISKADINISVTGIAGPEGGTEEKPVGTVYLGISLANSKDIIVEELDLQSRRNLSREQIRELASIKTLYKIIGLLRSTDSDQ